MTIGERLAALRPEERRHEQSLKEAVNQASTEIAHEYLAEIAPHTGDLELEQFLRRLPGHILARAEVEKLFAAFHELVTSSPQREIDESGVGKLAVLAGVREYPVRVKCATLPWHTLKAALESEGSPAVVSTESEGPNAESGGA